MANDEFEVVRFIGYGATKKEAKKASKQAVRDCIAVENYRARVAAQREFRWMMFWVFLGTITGGVTVALLLGSH
jgi:hypothetical protein